MSKLYYYLDGAVVRGPLSVDELRDKNLSSEVKIWTGGWEKWEQLSLHPEILATMESLSPVQEALSVARKKNSPETSRLQADVRVITEKAPGHFGQMLGSVIGKSMLRLNIPSWLRMWVVCHTLVFFLSLTGADFFNGASRSQKGDVFWPFGGLSRTVPVYGGVSLPRYGIERAVVGNRDEFGGLFYGYDISEFIAYLALGFGIHFFKRRAKR